MLRLDVSSHPRFRRYYVYAVAALEASIVLSTIRFYASHFRSHPF
jgi:hypothetical protein